MGLNLAHGGHLSHGSLVNTSGIIYTPCEYNLNQETGRVDYDQMEEVALREKPKMIIGGGSAYSREWDYKRMREIADKVGAILMIDMAHPAGLIAAGLLENPVKYAHIVTSTTHKTLRGPRGGVIMMGKDFPNPWGKKTPKGEIKMMSQLLDSAVFPGVQGGPLEHVIAAKAVAFGEILQPEYKEYAKQVQKNAAVLAQALIDRGFTIVSGGTDNHSMLVDLRSKYPDLTGKVAEKALVSADITVNKNMVPFDSRSAFQTSGIRLGSDARCTLSAAYGDAIGAVPKTVIYSLNPNDDEAIGTIIGCFQNSDAVGKIQQGSAWWFNDHKTGMTKQMTSLANLGLLGNFIGMLTDSRSFLSYPRHEYFRRILCEMIGNWVENGEYPKDMKMLERIVKGISYNNAVRYFGFELEMK